MSGKSKFMVVGGGGVGTIVALNLESGSRATVTLVLRSNYLTVQGNGFTIHSCDHGNIKSWRPSKSEQKGHYLSN